MARTIRSERLKELYEAILMLENAEECQQFFEDLCSVTELSAMEQRYAVAKLLLQDEVYLDILMKTRASTATISRVKRMLLSGGGTGCMARIIKRMQEDEQKGEGGKEST